MIALVYFFFKLMLSFLERVVSEEGISTDPDKIKTVQDWPRPKTPKQMRGFLGLCSYHSLCNGLAMIAKLFTYFL
jgi:hypothetical protein